MIEMLLLAKKVGITGASRSRLLALALLPLVALVDFTVLAALVYAVSFTGVFLPIVREGMGTDPAAWVLWVGDPAWTQMAVAALLGLVGGYVCGKWPLVSGLAMVLTFPSFLSVKALAVIFLSERLGFRLRDARRGVDVRARGLALLATLLGALALFVFGQLVQMMWTELIGFESIFHPRSRFVLAGLVVSLGLCLEVLLNLVSFHFHFEQVSKAART
ncbi:MAG: hypothetical protein KF767_10535 [Bdellovibrionaceae bacterium]|nr:hypothetical protein [Pseudobdellovibrionaceae bacterium]